MTGPERYSRAIEEWRTSILHRPLVVTQKMPEE